MWWISPNITKISDVVDKTELIRCMSLKPLLKALMESTKDASENPTFKTNIGFFFVFRKSNLFFTYPVTNGKYNTFMNWTTPINPTNCFDKDGNRPTYYAFYCRDWFREYVEILKKDNSNELFISSPYEVLDFNNKNKAAL